MLAGSQLIIMTGRAMENIIKNSIHKNLVLMITDIGKVYPVRKKSFTIKSSF